MSWEETASGLWQRPEACSDCWAEGASTPAARAVAVWWPECAHGTTMASPQTVEASGESSATQAARWTARRRPSKLTIRIRMAGSAGHCSAIREYIPYYGIRPCSPEPVKWSFGAQGSWSCGMQDARHQEAVGVRLAVLTIALGRIVQHFRARCAPHPRPPLPRAGEGESRGHHRGTWARRRLFEAGRRTSPPPWSDAQPRTRCLRL